MILDGHDLSRKRLLIAEIGNNHEGDPALAREMVVAAAEAGADAVKVQVITPDRLVNVAERERITQLSRFRLSLSTFEGMADLARSNGLLFIATPFDPDVLQSVRNLVSAIKIASGDLDYVQLLGAAAQAGPPIIISTGAGTLDEVRLAVDTIARHLSPARRLSESLALLHCVSSYPTPVKEANLRAIDTLRKSFGLTVGYSDHTLGIEAAIVAACRGARIIEKHFTLDKRRTTFRDHALSADPEEMRRLAAAIHSLDEMLGEGEKEPVPCEMATLKASRRGVVAAHDLKPGTRLTEKDLDYVRPCAGLPPSAAGLLIGRELGVELKRHDPILVTHLV